MTDMPEMDMGTASKHPHFLNVILSGLSCIVIDNQCIEIQVPCIEGHSYWAGTLNDLKELEPGQQYHLGGVCFGSKPVADCTTNIVFNNRLKVNRGAYFLRNALFLPHPEYVIAAITAPAPAFYGKDAPNPRPNNIPLVTVFKYRIDNYCDLRLFPLKEWAPTPDPYHPDYVNLFIFTEHDSKSDPKHFPMAFEKAMCMWPGTDCRVDEGTGAVVYHPVSGIDPSELIDLCKLNKIKKESQTHGNFWDLLKASQKSIDDTPNCPNLTAVS